MVSPSQPKLSKIASQQQQQPPPSPSQSSLRSPTSSSNTKVKLVKGPKPLIHHRFYLDIERHQVATKIETTIKELGGSIEFFLNKDITHFITDKHQQSGLYSVTVAAAGAGERNEEQSGSPGTPLTRNRRQQQQPQRTPRQHLHPTHQPHTHGQHVNDYGPATSRTSSPCPPPRGTTPTPSSSACTPGAASVQQQQQQAVAAGVATAAPAALAGLDGKGKSTQPPSSLLPAVVLPRSRADAMLQRVRQQQHQNQQHHQQTPTYHLLHSSPLNPPVYIGTPTKSETPPTFQASSHHKQQPYSPCYSPSGAGAGVPVGVSVAPRQNSPIQLARSWGTPVWSAEHALKFLRKVHDSLQNENRDRTSLATTTARRGARGGGGAGAGRGLVAGRLHRRHHHHHHHHQHQHVHQLRGHFIKIECRSDPTNFRPVYQELKRWPVLLARSEDFTAKKAPFADVNEPPERAKGDGGDGPPATKRSTAGIGGGLAPVGEVAGGRMTRKLSTATAARAAAVGKSGGAAEGSAKNKVQPRVEKVPPPRDCGYCEICRIEYDSLAVHVQSDSHRAFVQNDDNFLSLDQLIGAIGGRGDVGGGVGFFDSGRLLEEKASEKGGAVGEGAAGAPALRAAVQQDVSGVANDSSRKPQRAPAKKEAEEKKARGLEKETVTVTVTTTTTAAADELIEQRENPIGDTSKTRLTQRQQQQQQQQQQEKETEEKLVRVNKIHSSAIETSTNNERELCDTVVEEHSPSKQDSVTGGDSFNDSSESDTSATKELIKRALESAIAYFEGSSEGHASERKPVCDYAGEAVDCAHGSAFGEDGPARTKTVSKEREALDKPSSNRSAGESDKSKSAANSNSVTGDSKTHKEAEDGTSEEPLIVKQVKRSVRSPRKRSVVDVGETVLKRIGVVEVTKSGGSNRRSSKEAEPEEEEEESSGMFGRRSAIHHHPHNQLNHHNHQKHKSTLSALLLQRQREREQQPDLHQETKVATISTSTTITSTTTTVANALDHAAGMKVITDFRKEQAELVADKSVLVVVSGAGATGGEKEQLTASDTTATPTKKRRKRRGVTAETTVVAATGNETDLLEKQEREVTSLAMGLKASTTATSKHQHHHRQQQEQHHLHMHHHDSAVVGLGAMKTRHAATEMASHHLLECDGLDAKNTKRISLGLRQNPKRANLNEDFTSLLDETLERSKSTASSAPSSTVARKAQSRIRQTQKGNRGAAAKDPSKLADEGEDEIEHPHEHHHNSSGCEEENVGVPIEDDELHLLATTKHEQTHAKGECEGSPRKRVGKKGTSAAALEDIKVRGIRWRAPSPNTRPPVKSPLLYKVIEQSATPEGGMHTSSRTAPTVMSCKKTAVHSLATANNSTSSIGSPAGSTHHNQRQCSKSGKGSSPRKNGLIVKIRRVRQSELSLLNDEAENFMFPRKDDSSSDADTDDDRQTSSEGFRERPGADSIDLPSSSEGDRVKMDVHEDDERLVEEADEQEVLTPEEEDTSAPPVVGRKRKRAIPSTNRGHSIERQLSTSSSLLSSALSSPAVGTAPPVAKRQKLDVQASSPSASGASRRKGQQTADYDKCQDPSGSGMRFPEAPIQPGPVAAVASSSKDRTRRRRSPSVVPEDDDRSAADHDDDSDDDNEEEEMQKEVKKEIQGVGRARGRGRGRGCGRGRGRGRRKNMEQEDTITSTTTTSTIMPTPAGSCNGSCICTGISRRARRGGRRGRRGRGGVSYRGGARGRMLTDLAADSMCRCHLLDAKRMPPPSGTLDGAGWQRASDEDGSVSSLATTPGRRKGGSRASKTKTTPPSAAVVTTSCTTGYADERPEQSSSFSSCGIMNSNCYTSCSSSGKGKEDGMGAVFKWINFRKRCEEIEPYRFAFERVPSLEPWYETFQRQDDGTEKVYEYFGSTGYRKLPYEMGPLPALGQNCCILNYKVVACRKSNRTASQQSSSSCSMEPPSPGKRGGGGSRPSSADTAHRGAGGATEAATLGDGGDAKKMSPSSSLSSLPLKKRKLLVQESGASGSGSGNAADGGEAGCSERSGHGTRISRLIAGGNDRPRKSPREHASTLAILSLLQQQQHRKRAAAIKILTSPKKASTATATQTSALLEHPFLHQEVDFADAMSRRSCSRASDRGAGGSSSNGAIKFERPLFPDSSYVNSRTLCQEMDAFLTEELNRVAGGGKMMSSISPPLELSAIVKKEALEEARAADALQHALPSAVHQVKGKVAPEYGEELALLLTPSIVREGIAIERDSLPASKRDLLDVLQTVGSEPPLSLKLVQRCESVVKKIVQYDRKLRPMLAGGSVAGLGISSVTPTVIGLQLFDSGSVLAGCGGGPGGGSILKKRINRTGWPTNKRKMGTRTRQQARFMIRPSSLPGRRGRVAKLAAIAAVKKEIEEEEEEEEEDGDEEEDEEKTDEDDEQPQPDLQDGGDEDDKEEEVDGVVVGGCEDEEEEYDTETVVEATNYHPPMRVSESAGLSKKQTAKRRPGILSASHEKTDIVYMEPEIGEVCVEQEKGSDGEERNIIHPEEATAHNRRRCISTKSEDLNKTAYSKETETSTMSRARLTHDVKKEQSEDEGSGTAVKTSIVVKEQKTRDETSRLSTSYDTMPTLRAALMRDNGQLQRTLNSPLLAAAILAPKTVAGPPSGSVSTSPGDTSSRGTGPASSVVLPSGSNHRGPPVTNLRAKLSECSSFCPTNTGHPSTPTVVTSNCCKYVTKTTTTMTRVDYDGVNSTGTGTIPSGCSNAAATGKPTCGRKSREGTEVNEEPTDDPPRPRVGTSGVVDISRVGEWSSVESSTGLSTKSSNRHRLVGTAHATATVTSSATLANEDDDKECDSISSRSIFVSDDCDTTSSSTVLNPPDDVGESLPLNSSTAHNSTGGASTVSVKTSLPNESAESSEDDEITAQELGANVGIARVQVGGKGKAPRTPSERIRNKMVKNRRVAIRISLGVAVPTVEKCSVGVGKAKQQHPAEAHSTRRRTSSALFVPPQPSQQQLPPPSMMPLSPPLTTSTSSSSSSSCGADDKPMSPLAACKDEHEEDREDPSRLHSSETPNECSNNHPIVLTPSKIKTRSSTFGRPPAKRTYGGPKVTPVKYPYVSLVRGNFIPKEDAEPLDVVPLFPSSPIITPKRKRRRKEVEPNVAAVSPRKSTTSTTTSTKVNAKPAKTGKPLRGKKKQQPKMTVAEENIEKKVKQNRPSKRKPVADKSPIVVSVACLEDPQRPKVVARKRKLKVKVFNHESVHFDRGLHSGTALGDDEELSATDDVLDPLGALNESNIREKDHHQVHLVEEHLIDDEDEEEVPEPEKEKIREVTSKEDRDEPETVEEEEEEHIEMLELMEVEEDEFEQQHEQHDDDVGGEEEEEPDGAFLTGDEADHDEDEHETSNEEKRKLMIADHDYGDHHRGSLMIDEAEFVEVEELVEDLDELEEEEQEDEEEVDCDEEEDGAESVQLEYELQHDEAETTKPAPPMAGAGKQNVKLSPLSAAATAVARSATSTNVTNSVNVVAVATTTTTSNSSPTKYSPRKLRKPRGRWYRER